MLRIKSSFVIAIGVIISMALSSCSPKKNFDLTKCEKLCDEKKFDEALKTVDDFLKEYPNDSTALAQKGYILIKTNKNEEGILLLTKLLEKRPKLDSSLNNISWGYNNLHMYKMANEYIDRSLKIKPNSDEEYINKGNALHGLKNYDEAIKYFDEALIQDSKSQLAFWGKGICYYGKKDYNQAIEYFKKYNELSPNDKQSNYYIRTSYFNMKDYDGAINEFKKLIEKNPKDISAYTSLGLAYEQKQDYIGAISCYDTLIKNSPESADAYYNKAICLNKLGKKAEACENLKLAIKYDSEYIYDIEDEPDFDSLRDYDKFKELLKN